MHAAGSEVVLIARGDHLDALRKDGLHLLTPDGEERHEIPVAGGPDELTLSDDDVVLLTMKGQDTVDALDALRATAPTGIAVVCAQNGVANERAALRRFENVYGMCVWLPGVFLTPGVVVQHASPIAGSLDVGRYPTGDDDRAARIAGDLTNASFASNTDPAIMGAKYRKLLSNLGNALDAMTSDGFGSDLYRRAQAEAEAVFAAAGIEVQPQEEAQMRHVSMKEVPGHEWAGSSSRQSLARGTGSIEVDYLNGEVVLLGRLHGVPTPANELARRLANRYAAERRPPGSLAVADFLAMLENSESRKA
jgi:2-dehydropantoate 2-reductase